TNEEEFNETNRTIQLEIHKTCKQVDKIKRNPLIPNVTWWNRDLQIKKRELKALARRLQKKKTISKVEAKIESATKLLCQKKSSVQKSSQKSPTWILKTAIHPDTNSLQNSIPVSIKSLQTTLGLLSNNGKLLERNSHSTPQNSG
ncbi:hypothetical protein AVEN_180184-1, partial [Araneus ventricosus]